jgi:hypothetical protein
MESIQVEILNPKAKSILNNLADLKLINITKSADSKKNLVKFLNKIRSKNSKPLTLKEITKEVEFVRSKRYSKAKD